MRFKLMIAYCFLCFVIPSCTSGSQPPDQTFLYVYRYEPPAFVEFSEDFQIISEIPFSIPLNCALFDVFSAPIGSSLLVELSCPTGQTVLFLDTDSGSFSQPVSESDSHFLAWSDNGRSAYLKVDSLGNTRVVRSHIDGKQEDIKITGWTYDISSRPFSDEILFTFSRGLGYGSELRSARGSGQDSRLLYEDPFNYISFARYSPDGSRIAFIKIPDSQTPFTVGELWVMDADGSSPRKLTEADAGHGYAASWSPDGEWIAFVKRENPQDENADQSSDLLISNIYIANVRRGDLKQITFLTDGRAETPHWSPDGNTLAFNIVRNGRMEVQTADIPSGEIWPLTTGVSCCPAWLRK